MRVTPIIARRIEIALVAFAITGPRSLALADDAQLQRAISAIENLRGTVERGDTTPDGHIRVTEVSLVNTKVTDAGLVHLEVLKDLSHLYLSGCGIGDAGLS